jgi:hypothetical protein
VAKFFGKIGFATPQMETAPGVWEEGIVEHDYYGDVLRPSRQMRDGEKINNDLSVNNVISVVADAYANENFFAIRYIRWAGTLWDVVDVSVESPRLLLRLGGVYNGPTP